MIISIGSSLFLFGIFLMFISIRRDNTGVIISAVAIVVGFAMCVEGFNKNTEQFYYIEAESIAYGDSFTVFGTKQGNYIINGCYPDGTFLLTMSTNNTKTTDDDKIIVIWKSMDMEGEIK